MTPTTKNGRKTIRKSDQQTKKTTTNTTQPKALFIYTAFLLKSIIKYINYILFFIGLIFIIIYLELNGKFKLVEPAEWRRHFDPCCLRAGGVLPRGLERGHDDRAKVCVLGAVRGAAWREQETNSRGVQQVHAKGGLVPRYSNLLVAVAHAPHHVTRDLLLRQGQQHGTRIHCHQGGRDLAETHQRTSHFSERHQTAVGGPHKQVWLRTKMQPPQQPCLQTVQLNMGRDCYRPCH
jgi:hypothetical protein